MNAQIFKRTTLLLFILIIYAVIYSTLAYAACENLSNPATYVNIVNSSNTFYVNGDVALCTDTYTAAGTNLLIINASNVMLDCNQSVLVGGGIGTGVVIQDKKSVSIQNCIATTFNRGFYASNANYTNFTNNSAYSNIDSGLYLDVGSNNNLLINNSAYLNSRSGFFIASAYNNTLSNNSAYNNTEQGFAVQQASNNTFQNNHAYNNTQSGFYIYSSSTDNNITGNKAEKNLNYGFYLDKVSGNNLIDNNATDNNFYDLFVTTTLDTHCNNVITGTLSSGNRPIYYSNTSVNLQDTLFSEVMLCNADYSNMTNITVMGSPTKNNDGVVLIRSSNSTINQTNSSNNYRGFYLIASDDNNITNNTANSNANYGFYIYGTGNLLTYNSADNNLDVGYYLSMPLAQNIVINNTADNNTNNGFYMASSSNNQIISNRASNSTTGFYAAASGNNLTSNIALDNTNGFFISASNNFSDNLATLNVDGFNIQGDSSVFYRNNASANSNSGFSLNSATFNIFINSTADSNANYGFTIGVASDNNVINISNVTNNGVGIYLQGSSSNEINNNSITGNFGEGISIDSIGGNANTNVLNGNVIFDNGRAGISLVGSSQKNRIYNAILYNNAISSAYGIYSTASNNTFENITTYNTTNYISVSTTSSNNFTNFMICDPTLVGCVKWGFLNLTNGYLAEGGNIITNNTFISLYSKFAKQFNKSANITVNVGSCTNPLAFTIKKKVGFPATWGEIITGGANYVSSKSCATSTTLEFNVSSFSGYAAQSTGCVNLSDSFTYNENITNSTDNFYINGYVRLCEDTYNIHDVGAAGALIINASNLLLNCSNATIMSDGSGVGLSINGKSDVSIADCHFINYSNGFLITDVSNYLLSGGTIDGQSGSGIVIDPSFNITVENMNISDNGGNGIEVLDSDLITLFNNTLFNNSLDGVLVVNSTRVNITNNTINNNSQNGVFNANLSTTNITDNTICYNSLRQILDFHAASTNFVNNNFCGVYGFAKQWLVNFSVYDLDNLSAVSDTNITLYDAFGNLSESLLTDSLGFVQTYLTEYLHNGTDKKALTNYTANYTKQYYQNRSLSFNFSSDILINTSLFLIGSIPDTEGPAPPTVYDGLESGDSDWFSNASAISARWFNATDRSDIFYAYRIYEDGVCLGSCALTDVSGNTSVTATGLTLTECKNYSVEVRARDTYYNPAPLSLSDGAILDITPPVIDVVGSTTHPDQSKSYSDRTIYLNWTASDGGSCPSGIAGFSYVLDKNSSTVPDMAAELSNVSNLTLSVLGNGQWYFHLRTRDIAGNWGAAKMFNITIEGAEAVVTVDSVSTPTLLSTVNITGSVDSTANVSLFVDGVENSVQEVIGSFTFSNVPLTLGDNEIYAKANRSGIISFSNKIFVERLDAAKYNVTKLTISCSGCSPGGLGRLTTKADSGILLGAGTESALGVSGSDANSVPSETAFIFLTRSDADLQARDTMLQDKSLFDKENPSIGFPLVLKQKVINAILNYEDLSLSGDAELSPGRYTLIIKNNGLANGKPNITVDVK